MRRVIVATAVVVLCVILTVVLFVEKSNRALTNTNQQKSLSVSTYSLNQLDYNVSEVTITLANPTNTSFKNLNMTILLDGSDLLWYSNYTVIFAQLLNQVTTANFSYPKTPISIEPYLNETISIFFPSPESFQFSSHNLAIYISQHSFGDVVNSQSLPVPQTKAYLQIKSYSPVENDQHDTYHSVNNFSDRYVMDNPNFNQRFHNDSGTTNMYADTYRILAEMNALGEIYFNVTVFNNNTFPVNNIGLFGGSSIHGPDFFGGAPLDYVLQPNETYLFPLPTVLTGFSLPSNGYVIGNVANSTIQMFNPQPTSLPTASSCMAIEPLVIVMYPILWTSTGAFC
jgi:hypothetical protein